MAKKIIVSAEALTVVRLQDGSRVNVHKGAPVPRSADSDDVKRLLKEKYLVEVDVEEEPEEDAGELTVPEVLAEAAGHRRRQVRH